MTPRDERLLREAWSGPLSHEEIAKRFNLRPASVRKFWQREKKAGRLPVNKPRPHFVNSTTIVAAACVPPPAPVASEIVVDAALDREIGESERICGSEIYAMQAETACDESLKALRAAHGADPAHFHTMPAEWLLAESNSYLRSANEFAATRIIASLKKYLPHRDRMMAAFLQKRAARLAGKGCGA
jgi:hypothetical protein